MPSNISTAGINTSYPIAGQDNDTQGFRDNFSSIKYNFTAAATEITALQANAIASNSAISSLQSAITTITGFDVSTLANLASFQSYANATFGTSNYTNANVDSYLPTYTGNISANIVTLTSAIHLANLTTTQINAISPTVRGMMVYNYSTGNIQVYNGTKWGNIVLS
jgi:hypothetical protein